MPALVGRRRPDLVLLNDDDLTYAPIRLDERSLATARSDIGAIVDSLPRALCWAATWDMVRSAEAGARDFIAMVLAGIDSETDIGVVETLHADVADGADPVRGSGRPRPARRPWWRARPANTCTSAAPGSDGQLAWTRLFVRVAASDDDLRTDRRRCGTGPAQLDGLTVDTDLRWALIGALARHGRLDDAEIEAERVRDNTTAGAENAAGALAARPTAEAKAAAWASVIDRSDLPNRTQERIIGGVRRNPAGVGMVQSDQLDLLAPYVDRYFDVVVDVWATRTTEIARTIASGLYPRYFVSHGHAQPHRRATRPRRRTHGSATAAR